MSKVRSFTAMLLTSLSALALAACANDPLNGGYNGEASRTLTTLNPTLSSSQTGWQTAPPPAPSEHANFVYRGDRDPVTGQATLRN